jgi:exodeoxyribonuclease VII small subunit
VSETFEAHLAKLEEAVKRLESGEEPLDRSLEIYEEAVARLKACHELLAEAEGRVKILVPDGEGGVEERDFDAPEAE